MTTRTKRVASGRKMLAPPPLDPPIVEIRRQSVMLDSDLARAYGVTTAILNQAVKRNAARFPADFRFQVTGEEFANLMSQIVTSSSKHGGRRKLPWAFTEHGALMAATVLNSPRAVEMSVFVIRAFIRLRAYARGHAEIAERLNVLEQRVTDHDDDLREMFDALRGLLAPSPRDTREIGFAKT
jgi:hypothetical protein